MPFTRAGSADAIQPDIVPQQRKHDHCPAESSDRIAASEGFQIERGAPPTIQLPRGRKEDLVIVYSFIPAGALQTSVTNPGRDRCGGLIDWDLLR
jgi:hypothetical protein